MFEISKLIENLEKKIPVEKEVPKLEIKEIDNILLDETVKSQLKLGCPAINRSMQR